MRLSPFIFVLVFHTAFGQKPDSLLTALESAGHDTTRLMVLDAIIERQSQDYAIAEKYSLQMLDLSKSNAENASGKLREFYLHYYGTALNNLAYVEENKANIQGAIQLYEKALSTFREINDKAGEAMCLTNLGYVSKKTGELLKAIDYYSESLQINKEIKNQLGTFASINNLGLTFFSLGDMKKALASYFESLKLAREMGDKRREARALNNIAGVYNVQKEFKLQMEYMEKALALAVEAGEKRGEAIILVNIMKELLKTKEYDKAKKYAQRVMDLGSELSDKDLSGNGLSSLANISRSSGQLAEAMTYEKQALATKRGIRETQDVAYSLNILGELSTELKKPDDAIHYLNEAMELHKSSNYISGIAMTAKNLSNAYRQKGNSAKALEFYELHIKMRDSVANEDNRKATFKSQYKYEYEIKATADSIRSQGEKAVLSAQLSQEKSQRYALTAAIILGVTLAFFAFYRFRVRQQMKELQLRNRIASDLHDEVGSAISSISLFAGLAKMKSGKESDEIVEKIENTSRETVDKMGDIVWSIEPSNDRFDSVLKKMSYFGDQLMGSLGIKFNFTVEHGIEKSTFDMAKRKNIYLIYKEAINNAAKYSSAKNVSVNLSKRGHQYDMQIKDDGKGFDTTSTSMGNGLRNMKRRAEEMGGTLTIDSSENGTLIMLKV